MNVLKEPPELAAWRRRIERTKPELLRPRPLRKPGLAPQPSLFDELPVLVSHGAVKSALTRAERDRLDRLASDRAEAARSVEVAGRL